MFEIIVLRKSVRRNPESFNPSNYPDIAEAQSRRCFSRGHHRHNDLLKSKCLSIISEHLLGFGPTLAHEKPSSMFDLNIPVDTVRRWMTANNLWIPRTKRLKLKPPVNPVLIFKPKSPT